MRSAWFVVGITWPWVAWPSTFGEQLVLPSILMDHNRSKEWAKRFWVVEERQSLPLVFDATRKGHRRCGVGYGNVAITRVPPSVEEDALLVVIRAQSSKRQRYGRRASIGVLHATNLIQLLRQRPLLKIARPDKPVQTLSSDSAMVETTNTSGMTGYLPTWYKYKQTLHLAERKHEIYQSMQDKDIWKKTICCLNGLRDGRLFYLNTSEGTEPCLVTAATNNSGLHIYCIEQLHSTLDKQHIRPKNQLLCPRMSLVKTVWSRQKSRNIVPLIMTDGIAWPGHSSHRVWLMDLRGGKELQPILFSAHVREGWSNSTKVQQPWSLQDCNYLKGWSGSSPVLQFSEFLWIAIVHKYDIGQVSESNELGRTYLNKAVLFQADVSNMLPRRCLQNGPEASGRELFQRQPSIHTDWPFAFILGLVHLGVTHTYREGEEHEFLVSAGVDDSEPAMKVFSIFVPKNISWHGQGIGKQSRQFSGLSFFHNDQFEKAPYHASLSGHLSIVSGKFSHNEQVVASAEAEDVQLAWL